MPKVALTDRSLKALKPAPAGKRTMIWDALQPHLAVRVTDKGARSFVVVRRPAGSTKLIYHVLGRYPELSLAEARQQTPAILHTLAQGRTPEQVAAERRAAREAADGERKRNTFAAVAEDFINRHLTRLRSGRAVAAVTRRELTARWGDRPISTIGKRDVIEVIEGIIDRGGERPVPGTRRKAGGPYAARHALAAARKLFGWAEGRDIIERSPCDRIRAAELHGAPEARDRVLSDDEVSRVWRAAEATPYPFGPLIRALLLTGQRRDEIAAARWAEIDIDKALLAIAPERMKGKIGHTVPLTPSAVALLRTLPRFGRGDFVFSTTAGDRPFSGFSKAKRRFDETVSSLAGSEPIAPWTLHDIRRTVRTGLSSAGVLPVVAELVIGHKQQGIAAVYDLHRYNAEKREALARWEEHLLAIVGAKPVSLK